MWEELIRVPGYNRNNHKPQTKVCLGFVLLKEEYVFFYDHRDGHCLEVLSRLAPTSSSLLGF